MTVEDLIRELNGAWDRFAAGADVPAIGEAMDRVRDWCDDTCSVAGGDEWDDEDGWLNGKDDEDDDSETELAGV